MGEAGYETMGTNKSKTVAVGLVALLLVAGVGAAIVYFIGHDNEDPMVAAARARMASMPAPAGGAPTAGRQPSAYTGAALKGVVRMPDGKPVAGADIIVQSQLRRAVMPLSGEVAGSAKAQSGADGHFEVVPTEPPGAIIVRSPQGIAYTSANLLSVSEDVVLRPWGRIDGTARVGSRPASGAQVELIMTQGDPRSAPYGVTMQRTLLTADQSGHFSLDQVPPGRVRIGVRPPGQVRPQRYQELDVHSGATTTIEMGGNGRPVIGRLVPDVESTTRQLTLVGSVANPFRGGDLSKMSQVERLQAQREMTSSPEYRAWLDARRSAFNVMVDNQGAFRIDDVPAGKYTLQATYFYYDRQVRAGPIVPERVASVEKEITVAEASSAQSDQPFDLGDIQLLVVSHLAVGKPVPELNCVDSTGKPVKLSDFRGKYLLFSLTDGENARDWGNTVRAAPIFDRFGKDPQLAMLVIHTGDNFDAAKKDADESQVHWPMVHLQKSSEPLPEQYRNANLKMFLLDPEGNLLTRGGDPLGTYGTLESALAKNTAAPRSDINITVEQVSSAVAMTSGGYDKVPPPSATDAATNAIFTSVDGTPVQPENAIDRLHDGLIQTEADQPRHSFYYETATLEGRLKIELPRTMPIASINTYSWHKSDRGPQVYELFGSDGSSPRFNASPTIGIDPTQCGWVHIASVDTRPKSGPIGGRYAVSVSHRSGTVGNFRYLLFEMFPTETRDPYGHTLYGEIDVIERK